jgi:hypothetical protein
MNNIRKARFYQHNAYIKVDFLKKESDIVQIINKEKRHSVNSNSYTLNREENNQKELYVYKPEIMEINAIKEELESFGLSVKNDYEPIVSINDGYNALLVAHQILKKLKLSSENFLKENVSKSKTEIISGDF